MPAAGHRTLQGLVARRWSSLALLLTGVLTVAAATVGPLYARAAQESVLQDRLTAQSADGTGLHIAYQADVAQSVEVDETVKKAPLPAALAAYPTRELGIETTQPVHAPGSPDRPQRTRVVWRDGMCAHVVLVRGRCPRATGESMISARLAAGQYGYQLGGTLELPEISRAVESLVGGAAAPPPIAASLAVVGIYRPVDPGDGFWFGTRYFNAGFAYTDSGQDVVDSVFIDRAAFAGFAAARGQIDIDYPLAPGAVRLADLVKVSGEVRAVLASPFDGATFVDPLPDVLAGLGTERNQVATGSLLVSLQLVVLALLVLFAATGDALDARGNDVALAKLRGLTPAATLRFLLAETILLLLLAVPLGALVGFGATHLLAISLLVPGVPVVFSVSGLVATLAAFVGAAVAAAMAGRRVLTRPVLEQWRGAARPVGHGRRALVADSLVAVAATVGLVAMAERAAGSSALLAPGLLVLAVALLGVRLLPLLARAAVPRTRGSDRLGRYLAIRQVGRRPSATRLGVLLAVAAGLAVFAVGGSSIAAGTRTARAQVEIGAPRTVAVEFSPGADPAALTRTADPSGRWAMIAAQWLPDGGSSITGPLLGVDPTRLAAIGFPTTDGASLKAIAAAVNPPRPPAIGVRATSVQVVIDATDLVGPPPYVDVVLAPVQRAAQAVRTGQLQPGTHTYTADVPCTAGCELLGFGWERPVSVFDDMNAAVVLRSMTSSSEAGPPAQVDLGLSSHGGWRAQSPDGTDSGTSSTVQVTADGITDRFSSSGGSSAGIGRIRAPTVLPVWAGMGAVTTPPQRSDGSPGELAVLDANGFGYQFSVRGSSRAVPGHARAGLLADVTSLRQQLPSFTQEAAWSVWLGPHAPPDAVARLAAAGLEPGAVSSTSQREEQLARQGPALALALLLACAITAAVLSIAATAATIAATGRRRAFELAALLVVGVSRRALSRATVLEQIALLGTAVLLGVPSGVVAALVAMPVIPQFSDTSPLPLVDRPAVLPIVVIAGVLVALLVLTGVVAGRLLVRSAVPSRLRESAS